MIIKNLATSPPQNHSCYHIVFNNRFVQLFIYLSIWQAEDRFKYKTKLLFTLQDYKMI